MSTKYEEQALRPRGTTPREKLTFLINWYEKTAKMQPNDEFQARLFADMSEWLPEAQELLTADNDQIVAKIQEMIDRSSRAVSHTRRWVKNDFMCGFLTIELQRVVG